MYVFSTHFISNKICRLLDSNLGSLVSGATALPTEQQPLSDLSPSLLSVYFKNNVPTLASFSFYFFLVFSKQTLQIQQQINMIKCPHSDGDLNLRHSETRVSSRNHQTMAPSQLSAYLFWIFIRACQSSGF